MYVRVREYEVDTGQADALLAAYGAGGAWAQLERAAGYAGTQLFRDFDRANRFLTVACWADAASWESFLDRWRDDYCELDHQLRRLAAGGEPIVEGAAPGA
jgi:heme-degrading monooxygenase HmoA